MGYSWVHQLEAICLDLELALLLTIYVILDKLLFSSQALLKICFILQISTHMHTQMQNINGKKNLQTNTYSSYLGCILVFSFLYKPIPFWSTLFYYILFFFLMMVIAHQLQPTNGSMTDILWMLSKWQLPFFLFYFFLLLLLHLLPLPLLIFLLLLPVTITGSIVASGLWQKVVKGNALQKE